MPKYPVPKLPRPSVPPIPRIVIPLADAAIDKINNIMKNGLKDGDITGTICDVNGKPIPKRSGAGYWDHLTEMVQNCQGLGRAAKDLVAAKNALIRYKESLLDSGVPATSPAIVTIQQKIVRIDEAISRAQGVQDGMVQCFKGEMPSPPIPRVE